jgi:hypothetical protein
MTLRLWVRPWDSGQLSNADIFQPFYPRKNMMLKAVRTWIFAKSDPTYTSLNMKLYSNDDSSGDDVPKAVIATSTNVVTKAQIQPTQPHAISEVYFEFDDIPLQSDTKYNLVINGTGYSPTSSSFLGWRKAYPDPIYRTGYTPTKENLGIAPYEISIVGAEL